MADEREFQVRITMLIVGETHQAAMDEAMRLLRKDGLRGRWTGRVMDTESGLTENVQEGEADVRSD